MSWLWKSDESSPAAYEKALSKLSSQISTATLSLERTRSQGRRLKALWTLYTTLAYLIFVLILVLVLGPQNWDIPHYGGLIGTPLTIYGVRFLIARAYDWSSGRQQGHLNKLQKQRESKIADLKKATKYDSTQELLQKYGGAPPQKETPTKQSPSNAKGKSKQSTPQGERTGMPPPPTANIPARQVPLSPTTPPQRSTSQGSLTGTPKSVGKLVPVNEPGFAPNAFSGPQTVGGGYEQTSHWYDRILDVMLGEDENLAKNRLVMLCQNCRLVNGQAPPGVKTLEELGKWRCGSCGSWNGMESEGAKVVREMIQKSPVNVSQGPIAQSDETSGEEETTPLLSDDIADDTGKGTGKSADNDASVTKRVTRSSGQDPVEGL